MEDDEQKKQDEQKDAAEASDKADAVEAKETGDQAGENRIPAIEDAKKAAQELRNATAEQKTQNDRTEKLLAEGEVGGQAKMSPAAPAISEKERTKEYSKKIMEGKLE